MTMVELHGAPDATTIPTVFIVDDDPEIRRLLVLLMKSVSLRVQTFDCGHTFLETYNNKQPGCLILDVRMPGLSGPELQLQLSRKGIELPIVFVSAFAEIGLVTQLLRAGALDFFQKPFSSQLMIERVNEAIELDRTRRERKKEQERIESKLSQLSRREYEVMSMLADGATTKCIAHRLSISPKTVDNHRTKIYEKLKVDSPATLTAMVMKHTSLSESHLAPTPLNHVMHRHA